MKKIISILITLNLLMSLTAVSFAETDFDKIIVENDVNTAEQLLVENMASLDSTKYKITSEVNTIKTKRKLQ